MRKTLGYGYKLSNESMERVLSFYGDNFNRSIKATHKEIAEAKSAGLISKAAKPRIFAVYAEVLPKKR